MSDHDVLSGFVKPEPNSSAARKLDTLGRESGDGDRVGGYDLTNPNLHHGVGDIYRPFPIIGTANIESPDRCICCNSQRSRATLRLAIVIRSSDQAAYEGQVFSARRLQSLRAPAAGLALTFSGALPEASISIPSPASSQACRPTPTSADNPITVTATDTHGMTVSETFVLRVGDTGPTATAIAEPKRLRRPDLSRWTSPVTSRLLPRALALTFSGALPDGLHIDPHTGVISGVPTDADFGSNPITVTATDATA